MKVELIIPIETLRGMLQRDGYYFRMYKGEQIVQRCPNRKGHKKKTNEHANQQRFASTWGKRYKRDAQNGSSKISNITKKD